MMQKKFFKQIKWSFITLFLLSGLHSIILIHLLMANIKIDKPKIEQDLELPPLVSWDNLGNKPTSIKQIDKDVGDLAFHSKVTETLIEDNAITTPKLAANSVVAGKINVNKLSAISADLGTINAGEVNAIDINGSTITGGVLQTSGSGMRVVIDGDTDDVIIYDSSNAVGMKLSEDVFQLGYDPSVVMKPSYAGSGGMGAGFEFEAPIYSSGGIVSTLEDIKVEGASLDIDTGFVNFAVMSGGTASGEPSRDGSSYIRSSDNRLRIRINGTWKSVAFLDDLP